MRTTLALITALVLATATAGARAHDASRHRQHQAAASAPSSVRVKLPDTVLTDQHGRAARFKSDFVADRLVLVNFVYTTCTTVCPVQSALFADLQQRLGDRAGREVVLLSVTVDPLRDTPMRLKEFSAQYGAGPGWSFLTGSKQAVDEVLTAFDVYTPNVADHPAVVLVGDPRSGEWTRLFGFPGSEQIMARLGQLQAARRGAPLATRH
ncbi:SCO family protein [Ramlibacter montanisoli]|uniref:SCO family protein n=1 Tax=Ramlibacter montanisoli TaxID=2732512 RepID=A0A849K1E2_9BURK|nr:SCO family protein [Ramlibacter montanisoli]NNU42332.1 SCO family protein [Ramlibacter montanisoli]